VTIVLQSHVRVPYGTNTDNIFFEIDLFSCWIYVTNGREIFLVPRNAGFSVTVTAIQVNRFCAKDLFIRFISFAGLEEHRLCKNILNTSLDKSMYNRNTLMILG
jgi:hypothetical protein